MFRRLLFTALALGCLAPASYAQISFGSNDTLVDVNGDPDVNNDNLGALFADYQEMQGLPADPSVTGQVGSVSATADLSAYYSVNPTAYEVAITGALNGIATVEQFDPYGFHQAENQELESFTFTLDTPGFISIEESSAFTGWFNNVTDHGDYGFEHDYWIIVDGVETDAQEGQGAITYNVGLAPGDHQLYIVARAYAWSYGGIGYGTGTAATFNIDLTASAAPEPTTWIGLALGVGALGAKTRKWRLA